MKKLLTKNKIVVRNLIKKYFTNQAAKYWENKNNYMQAMIALALHREGEPHVPLRILNSLKESAVVSDELGMYWDKKGGYFWYQAPIESHALIIEAFSEITDDTETIELLKLWLIKNKQVTDWRTTKATAEACYALLLEGNDWLTEEQDVTVQLGDNKITPATADKDGTGYIIQTWNEERISSSLGEITIDNKKDGPVWGGLYWQYFEDLDKITPHETPLKLKKKMFKEVMTDEGSEKIPIENTQIKIGDKVIVQLVLEVDRAMEYIHLKDMRASAFEPIHVLSKYKYQDGLWYYETTKDASVNFFISWLPKGTYILEYPLRASQAGKFSNGISTIQCMYAPEFSAHTEGIRIEIGME